MTKFSVGDLIFHYNSDLVGIISDMVYLGGEPLYEVVWPHRDVSTNYRLRDMIANFYTEKEYHPKRTS